MAGYCRGLIVGHREDCLLRNRKFPSPKESPIECPGFALEAYYLTENGGGAGPGPRMGTEELLISTHHTIYMPYMAMEFKKLIEHLKQKVSRIMPMWLL